ncbi:MAG: thioesterase [Rhodobacteraceae bacterium]|nr:thioesterase [Paracoccaceae bacterium]|tara:strand:+ start:1882 stop:2286 length:405 start_codon:yes stop_codon:yes gene_type:complete
MDTEDIPKKMYSNDAFSQWLGMEILTASNGSAVVELKVRDDMTNGFGIAHGGIAYALADSALAFASNSLGSKAVSIETSISHTKPVKAGDTLKASTKLKDKSNRLARFEVEVRNEQDVVALFRGTVFITEKLWE